MMRLPLVPLHQVARIGRPMSVGAGQFDPRARRHPMASTSSPHMATIFGLRAAHTRARAEAGDIIADGQFDYTQLTAKGSPSGSLYGPASKLGSLATNQGCSGSDVDSLRACQEQRGAEYAAAMGAFVGALGTLIGGPFVGSALTAAWGAIVKAVGFAQAGYGTCDDRSQGDQSYVVDPTTDWRDWPYQFYIGNGRAGFYPKPLTEPTPGTFEAFADLLIQADFARLHNCAPPCPDHACGPVGLGLGPTITLAQAIAVWNATHSGSVTRYISRGLLNSGVQGGFQSGVYDASDGIGDSIGQALNAVEGVAPRSTVGFTINDGPVRLLSFGGAALQAGPPTPRIAPGMLQRQPSSGVGTALVVAGIGVGAILIFKPALLRGVPLLGRLARR